jgi:proteasome lid subunit RPN8/RPN11
MTASLVVQRGTVAEIKQIVYRTTNETGVRLVGTVKGGRYLVRHIIPPGERAVHRPTAYECDNDYAEEQFNRMLARDPDLKFLGELHVHPDGVPNLSRKDLATVRRVLRELPFFIAGTITRRPFAMWPVLFNRQGRVALNCVLR